MTATRQAWYWCALGAIAMSLGWGLRGSIGGGSLGAMIPGAMIGLVICLLLNRHADADPEPHAPCCLRKRQQYA